MSIDRQATVAAIQLDTDIGNTYKNLAACARLVEEAVSSGARWIGLPEFFNTGISWQPDLVNAIEFEDGRSARLLCELSKKYSVVLGGSFLCRLSNGAVKNRYLCFDHGELVGRHDKDIPTMWESAFYEAGEDDGVIGNIDGIRVGAAVCWEFMRTQTAKRMAGKVDIIMGGSHWWSLPTNWPQSLLMGSECQNIENAIRSVQETAKLIGAPVVHASHCNTFSCKLPGIPFLKYDGELEGNTAIIDAQGNILSIRRKEEGEGVVLASVELKNINPSEKIPRRYWLRNRTALATFAWHYQRLLGSSWYKKNVKKSY